MLQNLAYFFTPWRHSWHVYLKNERVKIFKNDDTTNILKTSNLPEEIFVSYITVKDS